MYSYLIGYHCIVHRSIGFDLELSNLSSDIYNIYQYILGNNTNIQINNHISTINTMQICLYKMYTVRCRYRFRNSFSVTFQNFIEMAENS